MTFLHAPPISVPMTSALVYGRKYPAFSMRCTATARPESLQAMTVAAGCPAVISLARLGPEITAACDGSTPVTSTMTWLIRIRVPNSMPLAALTRVALLAIRPAHRSRLVRIVCAGTASSTVVAPVKASAGSAVARMPAGNCTPGR